MKPRACTPLFILVLFGLCSLAWPREQEALTTDVKIRFSKSATDRRLGDKDAELVLDDNTHKLTVKNEEHPLDVGYADIQRVVFDVSTRMRGGALSQVVGGLGGAAIAAKHVSHYWCYVEYKGPNGVQPYLIEFPKEHSDEAVEKFKAALGDKVIVADFPEHEETIDKNTLRDLQSKHDLKVDKKNHPLPDLKPDKALVVVVCPPLAARYAGQGIQYKLHANDQVVAVNKMGTYSFTYLDPGDYLLVSQTENASGFRMKLEAGKDYYFLQDTFMGSWKAHTTLSRHTKELVMYELEGSYLSDWKRK